MWSTTTCPGASTTMCTAPGARGASGAAASVWASPTRRSAASAPSCCGAWWKRGPSRQRGFWVPRLENGDGSKAHLVKPEIVGIYGCSSMFISVKLIIIGFKVLTCPHVCGYMGESRARSETHFLITQWFRIGDGPTFGFHGQCGLSNARVVVSVCSIYNTY